MSYLKKYQAKTSGSKRPGQNVRAKTSGPKRPGQNILGQYVPGQNIRRPKYSRTVLPTLYTANFLQRDARRENASIAPFDLQK